MNDNTVYVGMDVHKESFTVCCTKIGDEKPTHVLKTKADYLEVLKYIATLRKIFGQETEFVCGYEAGCLGYSLYHQLADNGVQCVILAPSTMAKAPSQNVLKTDKRDAMVIAKCLAYNNYHAVHIPTKEDDDIKEYIRMRDDHKLALKKCKQQILSLCLRHGYVYEGSKNYWTLKHLAFLKNLNCDSMQREILNEYLLTFDALKDKIERFDKRIEEFASQDSYKANVENLSCFLGVKAITALATIVEVGDFKRFKNADKFAAYIGLIPGERTSSDNKNALGITKAGNTHVRRLLVEAAQSYTRGSVGYKSAELKKRQDKCSPEIVDYANKANERLRRKYYRMVLSNNKRANVAKTAVARELSCFIWGMMTGNVALSTRK